MLLGVLKKHKTLIAFVAIAVVVFVSVSIRSYASEGDSSFVTQSDGKSYEGLPDFPTSYNVTGGNTCYWIKFTNYVLYSNNDQTTYYLLCLNNDSGQLYIGQADYNPDGSYILSNGTCTRYNSSDLTSVQYSGKGLDLWCYKYTVGDSDWSLSSGYQAFNVYKYPKMLQSSCNIYTDSTCSSVFTQSAAEPLISGMSSTEITEILKSQVLGLVPSLIVLLTCLVGFWMAWRTLRRALSAA